MFIGTGIPLKYIFLKLHLLTRCSRVAHKLDYTYIDLSLPENELEKSKMKQNSNKTYIPQIFVNDVFRGDYEEFIDVNEEGLEALKTWLFQT